MFKKLFLLFLAVGLSLCSKAQYNKYIVRLTNKGSNTFSLSNPSQYLSQRALERRARYGIAIDSADLPVTQRYIDSIRLSGNVIILNTSKWLNQVAIQTTDAVALIKINQFPFVAGTSPAAARQSIRPVNKIFDTETHDITEQPSSNQQRISETYQYGLSNGQVKIHHGDFLHNHGFSGQNMQLAVLDAGFFNYLTLPTFDSVRNNNQVLGTWDFVNNDASVNEDNSHGMQCFSTIAANMPGQFVGTAPKASFYLFRTEDVGSEYPIEEQNWAAGAEKADSLGVDICSTSLGYNTFDDPAFDYTYADMNGHTSISARAANMASKKGMLMVTAAGNEGNRSWKFVITPGDADSAFTVGAVDTLGRIGSFSSYGPNSSGQVKPDVSAVGWLAIVANSFSGMPGYSNGTSFACPNMAGIATCLWQAFPEVNNQVLMKVLRESSSKFNNPDDRVGYGIPDAKRSFVSLQKYLYRNQSTNSSCAYLLQFDVKTNNSMFIDVERKTEADNDFIPIHRFTETGAYGNHRYAFDDDLTGIAGSSIAYRLVMTISTDTTYTLDSIVHILPGCPIPLTNDILINPNPFYGSMVVQSISTDAADVQLMIHNSAGQKVKQIQFSQQAGSRSTTVSFETLAKGVYYVTGYFNRKKIVTKKVLHR